MTRWLSDKTWESLDHDAGALDRRSGRRLAVFVLIGCLVLAALLVAANAGVFSSQIASADDTLSVRSGARAYSGSVLLSTGASFDEQVIGVSAASPGVAVVALTRLPARVPRLGTLHLRLAVTITDCDTARHRDLAVTLRVHRFWGTISKRITAFSGVAATACEP